MKFTPEQIKKYAPFIVLGVVGGIYGLLHKNSGSSSTTTTTTTGTDTTGTVSTTSDTTSLSNKITDITNQTNSALQSQQSYYDSLISKLSGQLTGDEATISTLTSDLHNTQLSVDQNTTNTNKIVDTSSNLSNALNSIQNQVSTIQAKTTTKPTITVKAGSVDYNILKAEYGDSINYDTSSNGIVGSGADRQATNSLAIQALASQGVTPKTTLSASQMNTITGTVGV